MREDDEDTRTYDVVINHEEQYSIWLSGRPIPAGWQAVGKSGLKTECLEYIERVWTDMRPLSLRKHMEALADGRVTASGPHAPEVQVEMTTTVDAVAADDIEDAVGRRGLIDAPARSSAQGGKEAAQG